ncbi:MAG: PLP-dependent aminotransferase family protein [Clostridia bacterium]|nr:PLP-dependent aminotransferase family protein [Clostridia bacterium]
MNSRLQEKKPSYLALYESLREEITSGFRAPGSRLPSRRVLARDTGLSVITVEHSYELLCQEGYAESRARSGYYVIYQDRDGFARPPSLPPSRPLPARADAVPDRFPFSVLARTMRRVLTEYGETLMEKSPNPGCWELRSAIRRYLARNRHLTVEANQIIIGSGAEYLYGLVAELLGRDRIYAIESPSYEKIELVYRSRGIACDLMPLDRDGIQSAALQRTPATVLHITPFRSFPSGVTASASKRQEYLRWADEPGRYIVEDDFESEFSLLRKPEETVFSRARNRNVIYLNTFSRTVSPSFRAGYMVLPPPLAGEYERRLGFYSCTVPSFEQIVLAELLDSGDFERHINRIRRARRKQQDP